MNLLPPPGAQRWYALVTVVDSIGTGIFGTGSIVFFTQYVGVSARDVGLALSLGALVGILVSVPAARGSDRVGEIRMLVVCYLAQAVLFAAYLVCQTLIAFFVLVALAVAFERSSGPARRSLLRRCAGQGARVRASAFNRSVFNVGIGVGSVLAGLVLAANARPVYTLLPIANSLSYLLAVVFTLGTSRRLETQPARTNGPVDQGSRTRAPEGNPLRDWRIVAVSAGLGMLYLNAVVLEVGVPLFVLGSKTLPVWYIAFLLTLNTVLVTLLQVPLSRGSESLAGSLRASMAAGCVCAASCLLFWLGLGATAAMAAGMLLAGLVLLSLGEIFASAGSWGMSYALAPEPRQGEYLAVMGLGSQLAGMVGPFGIALVVAGGGWGWISLAALFVAAGLILRQVVSGTAWAAMASSQ